MSEELPRVTGKANRSGEPGASRVGSLPAGASLPRRVYSQEFKDSAADLVLKEGYSALQAARQLGISHKTLNNWIRPQRKIKRDQMIAEGLQHDEDLHRARHLLEDLGLRGDEDPTRLSGGEARRAALLRTC